MSIIMHSCPGCDFVSNSKLNMVRHCLRKNICSIEFKTDILAYAETLKTPEGEFKCKWCPSTFTRANNRDSHQKRCKHSILDGIDLAERERAVNLTRAQGIRSFGNENISHISSEMMESYISTGNIIQFIRDIHFNRDVIENKNVKRISKSMIYKNTDYLAMLGENGEWVAAERDEVLGLIKRNACRILHAFLINSTTPDKLVGDMRMTTVNAIIDKKMHKAVFALFVVVTFSSP